MKTRLPFLFLLIIFATFSSGAQTIDPGLAMLREQFAMNYMQPEAHFALAKYYRDRGDNMQAFQILEDARRTRFTQQDFDSTYIAFFGDPMPEPPNEAKDLFEKGFDLVEKNNFADAEPYLIKAAKLGKSFYINAWVGRYYHVTRRDSAKALPYYYDSYFLYPHAVEIEYVEARIRRVGFDVTQKTYTMMRDAGRAPVDLLKDRNPIIVGLAFDEVFKNWKPEYLKLMLEIMDNDDSSLRWRAFLAIKEKAGQQLDEIVNGLLESKDLRKRGLAAYAVVVRKDTGFQILKKMLADPAELIRFDAISALAISGGPVGEKILRQHYTVEKEPRLKRLLGKTLKIPAKK